MYENQLAKQKDIKFVVDNFSFLIEEYNFEFRYIGDYGGYATIIVYVTEEFALEIHFTYGVYLQLDVARLINGNLPPLGTTLKGKVYRYPLVFLLEDGLGVSYATLRNDAEIFFDESIIANLSNQEETLFYSRVVRKYIEFLLNNAIRILDSLPRPPGSFEIDPDLDYTVKKEKKTWLQRHFGSLWFVKFI